MRTILDKLHEVGLKVKPSKCVLFKTKIQYLGHIVSAAGVNPTPDKIQALKDVRAFLGIASYYRKFVKGFATVAEPLTALNKKMVRFSWTSQAQEAFERLKKALMDATSLAFPVPYLPCILDTDASEVAIGAVLSQKVNGEECPIAFFSRVMNLAQKQYSATRRELLAVISALQHFRHYLIGNKVILRMDHYSLKWLKTFKIPEGIMARWIETLTEFDIEIEHRPGLAYSNVDGFSRPFCKQCEGKVPKMKWIDELQRADKLTEPLSINRIIFLPEITDDKVKELQAEDADLGPIVEWLKDGRQPTSDYLKSKFLDTRTLWAQVPAIHLLDGILVYKFSDQCVIQLVVPTAL